MNPKEFEEWLHEHDREMLDVEDPVITAAVLMLVAGIDEGLLSPEVLTGTTRLLCAAYVAGRRAALKDLEVAG